MFEWTDSTRVPAAAPAAVHGPGAGPAPPLGFEELVFLLNCYDVWSGPTKSAIQCAQPAA